MTSRITRSSSPRPAPNLDRWDFRKAFPTTEALFLSVGRKAYESFRNYMENIRLPDMAGPLQDRWLANAIGWLGG